MEELGIDLLFLLPFNKEFAAQTAQQFLTELKKTLPFECLILGHDGVIGSDRNRDLRAIGEELRFSVEYLDPIRVDGKIVSSSEIRNQIRMGKLEEAGDLLGRPYSIKATVEAGAGMGKVIGFHTANLPVEQLVLPPMGVYIVNVTIGTEHFPAIANLGYAPTLHKNRPPFLEVHLLKENKELYGCDLDVHFIQFLRPEKKFDSPAALKEQIISDVGAAHAFLGSRPN